MSELKVRDAHLGRRLAWSEAHPKILVIQIFEFGPINLSPNGC